MSLSLSLKRSLFLTALVAGLLAAALAPAPAQAEYIDLTDGIWQPGFLSSSVSNLVSIGGVPVNVTVSGSSVGFFSGPRPLSWSTEDGFGVARLIDDNWDEVNGPERLEISFSKPIYLDDFLVTDFYYEEDDGEWYQETGAFSTDNGATWTWFQAPMPTPNANGAIFYGVSANNVTNLLLKASTEGCGLHDFSVAGFNGGPGQEPDPDPDVPEPGTLILFGSAAGALGWYRRRRSNQA